MKTTGQQANRPLSLDGAWNVRELGGYRTKDGRITRTGVFFRADGTSGLSRRDVETLRSLGVTLTADLRSPEEVAQRPSRFADCEGMRYENVVMFDGMQSAMFQGAVPETMGELYTGLLDGARPQFGRLFRLFLENTGASLFHCTAGKDRTGVTAMLLLSLAGVPEKTIVADYAASEENLREQSERQKAQFAARGIEIPPHVFGSRPQDMETALTHLNARYGGAEAYLRLCGLREEELAALRSRFVGTSGA